MAQVFVREIVVGHGCAKKKVAFGYRLEFQLWLLIFPTINAQVAFSFLWLILWTSLSQTSQSYSSSNDSESTLAVDGNVYTCAMVRPDPENNEPAWWSIELDRSYDVIHIRLLKYKDTVDSVLVSSIQVIVSKGTDNRLCTWLRNKYFRYTNGFKDLNCLNAVNGNVVTIKKFELYLLLCEVQVFADLKSVNLAYKRPLAQTNLLFSDTTYRAVDGDPSTCAVVKSVTYEFPWLRVVLDDIYYITDVTYSFKVSKNEAWFTHGIEKSVIINLSDNPENYEERLCTGSHENDFEDLEENSLTLKCLKPIPARFVTIRKYTGDHPNILVICDVEVYSRGFPLEMSNITSPDCYPYEYKCLEAGCIHKDWLCDGTNDCPLADDEAPSCKVDESLFKCKRVTVTIDIVYRCDGVYNCPDYSDEEYCFDIYAKHLTATLRGESNLCICSDNWEVKYSVDICQQYNRNYIGTNYIPNENAQKHLKLNPLLTLPDEASLILLLERYSWSISCTSKKFVKVECDYKPEASDVCGKRYLPDSLFEPYIIKGEESSLSQWVWYVQIFRESWFYRSFCSGSLINRRWVLTAAHCLDRVQNVGDIYMLIGTNIYDYYNSNRYYASHVILHPLYRRVHNDAIYDIGLIRLKSMVPLSEPIRPICLPDKVLDNKTLMSYRHCVVTGFGISSRGGHHPHYLQHARMNYIQSRICSLDIERFTNVKASYIQRRLDVDNRFCGGQLPLVNGSSICKGDSGGPWMCKTKSGIWIQVGVSIRAFDISDNACSGSIFIPVANSLDFIVSVNLVQLQNYTSQNNEKSHNYSSLVVDGDVTTCSLIEFTPGKTDYLWWMVELDRLYNITYIRLLKHENSLDILMLSPMEVIVKSFGENRYCQFHRNKYLMYSNGYLDFHCLNATNVKSIFIRKFEWDLFLCEIQAFADLKSVNLAFKRPLMQQDILLSDTSYLSVDGNHTTCGVITSEPNTLPWLRVTLDNIYYVTDVTYSLTNQQTKNVLIILSQNLENYDEILCSESFNYDHQDSEGESLSLKCDTPTPARYVTITKISGTDTMLVICDIEVYSRVNPHEILNMAPRDCGPYEFKCLGGGCIHKDWLCDGTNDCPLADDEALSCKGDENLFKCKRINVTIDDNNRCDGVYNCPDKSDEEHCFEMYTKYMMATFRGESDLCICSDDWDVKYSVDICKQYDRNYIGTYYVSHNIGKKYIKVKVLHTITRDNSLMSLFNRYSSSLSCSSRKVVKVKCSYKFDSTYHCGKRYMRDVLSEPYIIRGNMSKMDSWPWHVQIFKENYVSDYVCGGSLVDKYWVLTSAYCLEDVTNSDEISMKIGASIRDDHFSEKFYASRIVIHPFYGNNESHNHFDVALIRLKSMVSFSQLVRPICLPNRKLDERTLMSYRHCYVVGFGKSEAGYYSHNLREARMNFVENKICQEYLQNSSYYKHKYFKLNNTYCAGEMPLSHGSNTCKGDSGNPHMCKGRDGTWTQLGIAHLYFEILGKICKNSIFVDVSQNLDFILTEIG